MEKFYLVILFWGICHAPADVSSFAIEQDSGLVSVKVGDSVTLHCFYDGDIAMQFSWYKQILGGKPQLLSTIYKYDEKATFYNQFSNDSRFSVQRENGLNHLSISNVQSSDSATYYCGSAHSNVMEFGEGTFLSVQESNKLAISQQPVPESVHPGDSLMASCTVHTETCDGEHTVYWFRRGYGQGIIHTHDEQCEKSSKTESSAQSCVYHLQMSNLSLADAGTYYCVVTSCREIVFGNGSRVNVENGSRDIQVLVFLSITRSGILVFVATIYTMVYFVKKWSVQ